MLRERNGLGAGSGGDMVIRKGESEVAASLLRNYPAVTPGSK